MKVRIGFVSNSSSSAFICNVCKETASGWDIGLTDAGMYECNGGHYFCETHLLEPSNAEILNDLIKRLEKNTLFEGDEEKQKYKIINLEKLKKITDKELEKIEYYDFVNISNDALCSFFYKEIDITDEEQLNSMALSRYEISKIFCPICQNKSIDESEAYRKLKEHFNLTDEQVLEIIAEEREKTK